MKTRDLSDGLLSLLATAPALRHLAPDAVRIIGARMRAVDLMPGEVLIRQGTSGDAMFVLLSGRLVAVLERDGDEQTLRTIEPGDIVGEVALLTGGERTATVRADGPATVASLTRSSLDHLIDSDPAVAALLTAMIADRLRRSELATHITRLFGTMDLAALRDIEQSVEWVTLRSGEVLFRQGDAADSAYVVVSGRVAVTIAGNRGDEVIGHVGRGETVGEIALLTRGVRSATIHAVRDTELARFSDSAFERLTAKYPGAMLQMSRIISTRLRNITIRGASRRRAHATLAVVAASPDIDLGRFCRSLHAAIAKLGAARLLVADEIEANLGREGATRVAPDDPTAIRLRQWLTEQEHANEFVIYQADAAWSGWTERAIDQADHVLVVADATADPRPGEVEERAALRWRDGRAPHVTLVLLRPATAGPPSGTAAWLVHRRLRHHFHVRHDHPREIARVARVVTGNAVGVVLGGGGARGFAHIGVLRALEENGVPVDLIGGTSMGGIVAAITALGYSPAETLERCRRYFADVFDYTLPLISILKARKISRQIEIGVEGRALEDFSIPFFCVSSNLSRAEPVVHTRGDSELALRATVSLPGILPPVYFEGDLLVDGGLLNNVPADVMRSMCEGGKVIAVDVAPAIDLRCGTPFGLDLSGWRVFWRRVLPFRRKLEVPHIANLLNRSAVLASVYARNRILSDQVADLYLHLPMQEWAMLDFQSVDAIAERGYALSVDAVSSWFSGEMRPETDIAVAPSPHLAVTTG